MNTLLQRLFARVGLAASFNYGSSFVPSRGTKLNKEGLPRGYPGAKLARRAVQKGIAVRHHGLRQDGVTC